MGRKSKMSFWPSSKRPNESAMEFDMVQFGASIASGILARGGLFVADASSPVMGTMLGSLSLGRAVPGLY